MNMTDLLTRMISNYAGWMFLAVVNVIAAGIMDKISDLSSMRTRV